MKSYLKLPLLFAIIILNVCCKTEVPPGGLVTENAMVVSARQEASAIGSAMAVPSALLFSLVFAFFIGLTYLIFYISKRGQVGGFDRQD